MADGTIGLWTVPLAVFGGAIRVSTPFLFVSLGECITERSGRIIWNGWPTGVSVLKARW